MRRASGRRAGSPIWLEGLIAGVLALAMAGCGVDDDEGRSDLAEEGSRARADVRAAVTAVEACFVEMADYSQCTAVDGKVEISDARAAGFTATAYMQEGNWFAITRTDSGLERTCKAPAEAGCEGGTW